MVDVSTTSTTQELDNSSIEPKVSVDTSQEPTDPIDTSNNAEPIAKETAENQSSEVAGDSLQSKDEAKEETLIAGKFKNQDDLLKAYEMAQKLITQKADESVKYKQELEIYRQQQEQAKVQREIEARQQGFTSEREKEINDEINNFEFSQLVNALESGFATDFERAQEALLTYRQTGAKKDLELAKSFFNARALEIVVENKLGLRNELKQKHQNEENAKNYNQLKQNLSAFSKEAGEWLDDPVRQSIITENLKTFGVNTDFKALQALIDRVEENAVEKYKKSFNAEKEGAKRKEQLQAPSGSGSVKTNTTDWKKAESPEEILKAIYK
jgi:hypothetical protein